MNAPEREESLARLRSLLDKPGGKMAIRYILNACGGIPAAGGFISGAASVWSELEQQSVNEEIVTWAKLTDAQISELSTTLERLEKKPTSASFALLIPSIVGRVPGPGEDVPIMLNSSTIEELHPYLTKGWALLRPTHSVTNMGAGNRVGNHIEDQKRPWGMGNGFVLCIPSWDLPTE